MNERTTVEVLSRSRSGPFIAITYELRQADDLSLSATIALDDAGVHIASSGKLFGGIQGFASIDEAEEYLLKNADEAFDFFQDGPAPDWIESLLQLMALLENGK